MIKSIYSLRHELSKFASVGAIAYVISVGGFNLLVHVDEAPLASKPITGSIISATLSVLFAYLGNRHWTWKDRKRSGTRREMTLFFSINGIAILFSALSLAISRYFFGLESALADNIAANVIGVGLGTIFRFYTYRTFVFKKDLPLV